MRYIIIPKPVVIESVKHTTGDKKGACLEQSFDDLILYGIVQHPDITADDASIGRYLQLVDEVKGMKPGEVWALQDEDHEFLSKLARTFQCEPHVKVYLLRHVKAITGAAKSVPKPAEEDAAPAPVTDGAGAEA